MRILADDIMTDDILKVIADQGKEGFSDTEAMVRIARLVGQASTNARWPWRVYLMGDPNMTMGLFPSRANARSYVLSQDPERIGTPYEYRARNEVMGEEIIGTQETIRAHLTAVLEGAQKRGREEGN